MQIDKSCRMQALILRYSTDLIIFKNIRPNIIYFYASIHHKRRKLGGCQTLRGAVNFTLQFCEFIIWHNNLLCVVATSTAKPNIEGNPRKRLGTLAIVVLVVLGAKLLG